jgi:hypothetical protein
LGAGSSKKEVEKYKLALDVANQDLMTKIAENGMKATISDCIYSVDRNAS